MLRCGSEITQIDDIGEVEQPTSSTVTEISNPEIIQLDTCKACLKCKAHVEPLTPPLGRCSKLGCAMMQVSYPGLSQVAGDVDR